VIPAFAVAAVIEGFVTGHTGAPLVEVLIGAAVMVAYLALLLFPQRDPGSATRRAGDMVRAAPVT
jgi:hypothetical protein